MSIPPYKIIKTKKLTGSVSIRIKEGEVIVRAPFWYPKIAIENFLEQKKDWILKALQKTKLEVDEKDYQENEKHLYLGKAYPLKIITDNNLIRTRVEKIDESLVVFISSMFTEAKKKQEIKDALLRFYLENAIHYITDKVNYYTQSLGVEYSKIEIKKVSSIWGSCSGKNVLSFNRKLIMSPEEIIGYVIIHEVCHLRERNHSSRFWGLVFKYDRQYKDHRRWLHNNSSLLTI